MEHKQDIETRWPSGRYLVTATLSSGWSIGILGTDLLSSVTRILGLCKKYDPECKVKAELIQARAAQRVVLNRTLDDWALLADIFQVEDNQSLQRESERMSDAELRKQSGFGDLP
jgi:hypothetical protein